MRLNQPTTTGTLAISDLTDLERAISRLRDTVGLLVDGNPHKYGCLANLASSLFIRFWCLSLSNRSDLEEAHGDAVMLFPNGHSNIPACLLALALTARFQLLGDLSDLEDAISRHKDVVELLPSNHSDKAGHLSNLGNCLVTRSEYLGKTNDIEAAVSSLMDAVKLTPDVHLDKPNRLNNPALSLRARSKVVGEMNDVEEAISSLTDAVQLMFNGHPDKPSHLNDLALTLQARFEHLCELKKLRFLRFASNVHSSQPDTLINLAHSADFALSHPVIPVTSRIQFQTKRMLPGFSHPNNPTNIRDCLVARLEYLWKTSSSEAAISCLTVAVKLTPDTCAVPWSRFLPVEYPLFIRPHCHRTIPVAPLGAGSSRLHGWTDLMLVSDTVDPFPPIRCYMLVFA